MLGVESRRLPLYQRSQELAVIAAPVLIIAGDDEDATLDVALYLKRTIPRCGLLMLPKTGHAINLEEPSAFRAGVADFFAAVKHDGWGVRPGAPKGSTLLPNAT